MRNPLKRIGKELVLKGNIRILAIMAVLGGTQSGMLYSVWQPFVISLGASVAALGFLSSLGWVYGVIFGSAGGWASDRLGRKPLIILGEALGLVEVFTYVMALIVGSWLFLIPGTIIAGISVLEAPAWDTAIAESVKRRRRGTAFAVIGFFSIIPTVIFPVIGGYIAGTLGFIVIFFTAIILESVILALVYSQLKETLHRSIKKVAVSLGGFRKSLGKIFAPPASLRSFYLVVAADAISWGLGSSILYGMLVKSFNFTVLQIGALVGVLNFSKVAVTLPFGRLMDKYGCKLFMLTAEVVGIFVTAGWLLSTRFDAFVILAILNGISITAWFPAYKVFLAGCTTHAERGTAMGRIWVFRGIAGFPAPLIGGILYDHFGLWAPISGNLIGVLITTILIVLALHEPK
jgi:DHA1 family multidrug resistance protein-like MFS transporter